MSDKRKAGRPKGKLNKTTVWVLEAMKRRGYDYEKELVNALKDMSSDDMLVRDRAMELVDRLIKLAPHIANKPKETVGMEGIDNLVIGEVKEKGE